MIKVASANDRMKTGRRHVKHAQLHISALVQLVFGLLRLEQARAGHAAPSAKIACPTN